MWNDVTVLILTYNERENIGRTLKPLGSAKQILTIDSYSTDETLEIAGGLSNVRVVQHPFESFAAQCNYALSVIDTEWVLSIDADYVLTPQLIAEISALKPDEDVSGYSARFYYNVYGRRLRSTLYPPRTVLYRKSRATYRDEGHGHRVSVSGQVLPLQEMIDHDDRKPLTRWLASQDKYTIIEARHLLATPDAQLSNQDRLRKKIYFAAPVMFLYLLFGRGLILDGWPGWYYVMQRTIAEMLLSLRLVTLRHRLEE